MQSLGCKECPSCRKTCCSEVDLFFIHHRGLCAEEYHAGVAVREAALQASRPPEIEAPTEELLRHNPLPPRPPRPPKVYRAPAPDRPLPMCRRDCGRQLAKHTLTLCGPCRSDVARERWVKDRRDRDEWARTHGAPLSPTKGFQKGLA